MADELNELGFYMLAGAPEAPVQLLDEMAAADVRLGAAKGNH